MALRIPIGPGPARELLKVVKAMHKEVDSRLNKLEQVLQKAANAKTRSKKKL